MEVSGLKTDDLHLNVEYGFCGNDTNKLSDSEF